MLAGCTRLPELARGPIDISESALSLPLDPPVNSAGSKFDVLFEFDQPGDSHQAGMIHVALVTSDGARDTLTGVQLDRRGEGLVSQLGHPGAAGAGDGRPRVYSAIEVWSEIPLRLRGIRGASVR
ncbi:MAG: hypothetical protein IPO18_03340 [bacterium]|nr:hypothetical protein [bacterium]